MCYQQLAIKWTKYSFAIIFLKQWEVKIQEDICMPTSTEVSFPKSQKEQRAHDGAGRPRVHGWMSGEAEGQTHTGQALTQPERGVGFWDILQQAEPWKQSAPGEQLDTKDGSCLTPLRRVLRADRVVRTELRLLDKQFMDTRLHLGWWTGSKDTPWLYGS